MSILNSILASGIVVAVSILPMFALLGFVLVIRRLQKNDRVSPLGTELLRPAGYSLFKQIDDLESDLMCAFMALPMLASVLPLSMLVREKMTGESFGTAGVAVAGIFAVLAFAYQIRKVLRIVKRLQHLRLGYACEVAVGQELEQIVRPEKYPYRVFHDIPFDGFNVDHLAVSPNGVFVIETKGRSKLIRDGKKQARVTLENNALRFPGHTESEPLQQVQRNVKSVKKWLKDATGYEVPVVGVLVLPGWFIERKQRSVDPYVLNGKELPIQLPKLVAGSLTLEQVTAVSYQVDQKVRDVDRERGR